MPHASRSTVKKPPRTRFELDERRAQLIKLGFELFAEHPYDEVHIESVARAAGISKGLLYHYFPTKRDFYTATLQGAAERLLAETDTDMTLPPPQQLIATLNGYLQFVERYAATYVALMRGGVGSDPKAAAIIEQTRATYMDRLMNRLSLVAPSLEPQKRPLVRTALRGWLGFVEATSLEWAVARDVPKATLVNLLVQILLSTLQTAQLD